MWEMWAPVRQWIDTGQKWIALALTADTVEGARTLDEQDYAQLPSNVAAEIRRLGVVKVRVTVIDDPANIF